MVTNVLDSHAPLRATNELVKICRRGTDQGGSPEQDGDTQT